MVLRESAGQGRGPVVRAPGGPGGLGGLGKRARLRVRGGRADSDGVGRDRGRRVSESDSFIDEVTEEVRRDKLFAFLRKYAWAGVALVALVVGGTAWIEWRKHVTQSQAEAFGDAVVAASTGADAAARAKALAAVPVKGPEGAVLGQILAAEQLAAGDRAAAIAALDAVASNEGYPALLRQLAQLKSVILQGRAMDPAARDAALAVLAAPGAPFRVLAVEQQALALVDAGKRDEALALFRSLMQDAEATQALRARVAQLMVALGADPGAA